MLVCRDANFSSSTFPPVYDLLKRCVFILIISFGSLNRVSVIYVVVNSELPLVTLLYAPQQTTLRLRQSQHSHTFLPLLHTM